MPKREPQLEARLPPMERFWIGNALSFGPWRLTGPDNEPVGERRYSDAELERHWYGWAKFAAPSDRRDWSARDWGWRRFELGEDAVAAFIECRRLQDERFAEADAERGFAEDDAAEDGA